VRTVSTYFLPKPRAQYNRFNLILVETVTLEGLLKPYKRVDLIKVDVEGVE